MIWHKINLRVNRGFTLVELLVVIVILSMLAGIVAPKLFGQVDRSKWNLTKTKMAPIKTAIDTYCLNCGDYPVAFDNLLANPGIPSWSGPYLEASQLIDPWGFEYVYVLHGPIHPESYDLISYGKDGAPGGDGYNAEQYND
jgi:general secretion pathway protein G